MSHSDFVAIADAKFVVQKGGRNQVLEEKSDNVHAFVRGEILYSLKENPWDIQVKYDPKADHFYRTDTGEIVEEAYIAVMDTEGVWIPPNHFKIPKPIQLCEGYKRL